MINTSVLEGVVNLAFDKNSKNQAKAAQECIAQTNLELMQEGIFPFRLGIQDMGLVTNSNDIYWETLRELKKVFDPKNIINPGRYNLI